MIVKLTADKVQTVLGIPTFSVQKLFILLFFIRLLFASCMIL